MESLTSPRAAPEDGMPEKSAPFSPARMEKQTNGDAIYGNQGGLAPQRINESSPFLHGAAAHNNQGEPAPHESSFPTSAPATFTTGAYYSTGDVGVVNTFPYAQSYGPGMPPPPPGPPMQIVNGPGMPPPPPGQFHTHHLPPSSISKSERRFIFWRRIFGIIGILVIFTIVMFVLKHFNLLKPGRGH